MRKFRIVIRVAAVLCLVVGMAVFAYPRITQWIYNNQVQDMVKNFEADLATMKAGAEPDKLDELYELLRRENTRLYEEGQSELKDPFSYAQPGIDLSDYGIEDNIIGYLVVPRLEETLPIYLGANEDALKLGAAHLTETSYPVGGENTNSVIAAHRGYYKANMCRNSQKLGLEDPVYVRNFHETLMYRVAEIKVIQPEDISEVLIQQDRELLTLISCHPYGQNAKRYVVYCERVYS